MQLILLVVFLEGQYWSNHWITAAAPSISRKNQLPTNNHGELFFVQACTLEETLLCLNKHPKNYIFRFDLKWDNSVHYNR